MMILITPTWQAQEESVMKWQTVEISSSLENQLFVPIKNEAERLLSNRTARPQKNLLRHCRPSPAGQEFRVFPQLSGDQPAWFAVYVQVNGEKEVNLRLQQKPWIAFASTAWSKRRIVARESRFRSSGYVFLHAVLTTTSI
jgi:hypothetical protein